MNINEHFVNDDKRDDKRDDKINELIRHFEECTYNDNYDLLKKDVEQNTEDLKNIMEQHNKNYGSLKNIIKQNTENLETYFKIINKNTKDIQKNRYILFPQQTLQPSNTPTSQSSNSNARAAPPRTPPPRAAPRRPRPRPSQGTDKNNYCNIDNFRSHYSKYNCSHYTKEQAEQYGYCKDTYLNLYAENDISCNAKYACNLQNQDCNGQDSKPVQPYVPECFGDDFHEKIKDNIREQIHYNKTKNRSWDNEMDGSDRQELCVLINKERKKCEESQLNEDTFLHNTIKDCNNQPPLS
tara:strand:+ start:569 stop:1456 length:888 start_codon:yes stop_codon:yes gene_type:complete